jgi:hypothetical protein
MIFPTGLYKCLVYFLSSREMDLSFSIDDVSVISYPASLSNIDIYTKMYPEICIEGLFSLCKARGGAIYELKENGELYSLGMCRYIHQEIFGRFSEKTVHTVMRDENNILSEISELTKELFNYIYKYRNSNKKSNEKLVKSSRSMRAFHIYSLKRYLFPNDENVVTKKVEYEMGFRVFDGISDIAHYKHQANIGDYRADYMFELRTSIPNMPPILFEVDENGHSDRNPDKEKSREREP